METSTLFSTVLPKLSQVILAAFHLVSFGPPLVLKLLGSLCRMPLVYLQSSQAMTMLFLSLPGFNHIVLACVKLRKTSCVTATIRILESAVLFLDFLFKLCDPIFVGFQIVLYISLVDLQFGQPKLSSVKDLTLLLGLPELLPSQHQTSL